METLKKIVKNQYFPAAAVLAAVLLFWIIAMFGGLSLLNNNQPPMATLTWMLFVYAAAVLTPLAGILAGVDMVRRWRRNRQYAQVDGAQDDVAHSEANQAEMAYDEVPEADPSADESIQEGRAEVQQPAAGTPRQPAPTQPVTYSATQHQINQQQLAKKQRRNAA